MFTIFHISDLHLGENLVPSEKALLKGFSGHDERTWVAFKDCLLDRIKNTKNDYVVCVTGDLSAIGNVKSYNLAAELLFDESDSDISKQFGLRLSRDKVFVIPGNHDSYDNNLFSRNNLRTFNGIFNTNKTSYPIMKEIECGIRKIRIIGLDSTYKKTAISITKKLGKGHIDLGQLRRFKELGTGSQDTFDIVALHHSPIQIDSEKSRTLMLDKSHDVIEAINRSGAKMVLCGHLHDDFYDSLPLKSIVKLLPKKRGLKRVLFNIFRETVVNDYKAITINGKKAKYLDSLAYHYIKQTGIQLLDIANRNEVSSVELFHDYIRKVPEYLRFIEELKRFSTERMAIVMCGSTCQENTDLKNSCLELVINDAFTKLKVKRYKYIRDKVSIEMKERELEL